MLEKKVKTDFGVDAQYWKVVGYAWSLIEEKGFISLNGYAKENCDGLPLRGVNIFVDVLDLAKLEKSVKESEQWKNLK